MHSCHKNKHASVVGSLMYVMVCTYPNIVHVVGIVSYFLSNPSKKHWNTMKWVIRYLQGISDLKICFVVINLFLLGVQIQI